MLAGFAAAGRGRLDLPRRATCTSPLADDSGRLGLGLRGEQAIPLGDLELDVLFGAPADLGRPRRRGAAGAAARHQRRRPRDRRHQLRPRTADARRRASAWPGRTAPRWSPRPPSASARCAATCSSTSDSPASSGGSLVVDARRRRRWSWAGSGCRCRPALSGAGGGSNPVASNLLASGGPADRPATGSPSTRPPTSTSGTGTTAGEQPVRCTCWSAARRACSGSRSRPGSGRSSSTSSASASATPGLTLAIDGGVSIAGLSRRGRRPIGGRPVPDVGRPEHVDPRPQGPGGGLLRPQHRHRRRPGQVRRPAAGVRRHAAGRRSRASGRS